MRGYYWTKISQMSVCTDFSKCTLLVDFFPARESIIWSIWWLYLLAEHFRSVQKKTAMQKQMFLKSYEQLFWRACLRCFENLYPHFWNFTSVQLCTWLSKSDVFCQKLSGFVSGRQSWNSFSWNSPCVFDFGHFHVFKKLTDMISSWQFWKTRSVNY